MKTLLILISTLVIGLNISAQKTEFKQSRNKNLTIVFYNTENLFDFEGGKIFSEEWMLYNNSKAGTRTPNKTYGGDTYFGGISDHLPVYVVLRRK